MHTSMHTCQSEIRHPYIHTYIHTYIYIYAHIHTYIPVSRKSGRNPSEINAHTYIHTYMHTYIQTYIHIRTHTYIHTRQSEIRPRSFGGKLSRGSSRSGSVSKVKLTKDLRGEIFQEAFPTTPLPERFRAAPVQHLKKTGVSPAPSSGGNSMKIAIPEEDRDDASSVASVTYETGATVCVCVCFFFFVCVHVCTLLLYV